MNVLRALGDARTAARRAARDGSLGLVPTMGFLHDGHLSLVRAARERDDTVAVTIFVNPLQFGEGEDFGAYPRDEARDLALLEDAGVDLALVLQHEEMYPAGFATTITQTEGLDRLEGAERPGHFDGVLTVVAKLFLLTGAQRAYFGQKDLQQTVVVRRMVRDLELPVDVVVCPIRRDTDGMALSSRNVYLDADGRRRGRSLVAALRRAEALFAAGETDAAAIERALHETLREGLGRDADYARLLDPDDLSPRDVARAGDALVVAGRVGRTRLLDNHLLGDALPPAP